MRFDLQVLLDGVKAGFTTLRNFLLTCGVENRSAMPASPVSPQYRYTRDEQQLSQLLRAIDGVTTRLAARYALVGGARPCPSAAGSACRRR